MTGVIGYFFRCNSIEYEDDLRMAERIQAEQRICREPIRIQFDLGETFVPVIVLCGLRPPRTRPIALM